MLRQCMCVCVCARVCVCACARAFKKHFFERRSNFKPRVCVKFSETTIKLKMRLAKVHKCLTIPLEVAI